jgi:hypothetical protein
MQVDAISERASAGRAAAADAAAALPLPAAL